MQTIELERRLKEAVANSDTTQRARMVLQALCDWLNIHIQMADGDSIWTLYKVLTALDGLLERLAAD